MKQTAQITPATAAQLPKLADRLGKIKAQIADLAAEEKQIKQNLELSGLTVIEGKLYRVTVSDKSRQVLDADKIREAMGGEFLDTYSRISSWREVRVVSR